MKTDWEGFYFDGKTAARKPVTVRIMRLGLQIGASDGKSLWWPYEEVRQTQGSYSGEQVRLERGGEIPEVLLVPDAAFLISLRELAPQSASHYHDPLRRRRRVSLAFYAAVGVVCMIAALYLWAIPTLATLLTPYVPISWEERLGESIVGHLAPKEKQCADRGLNEAVTDLTAKLTATEKNIPYKLRAHVVDSPFINAIAVPGGTILLFRGLIEKTGRPEELAGVMAHELQHILQRHTTRALIQHFSMNFLLAMVTGDATGIAALGSQAAQMLGALRYNREAEEEADEKGMEMLIAAGVDPSGMASFFETILKQGGDLPAALQFLSTHPAIEKRVERLKSLAQSSNVKAATLLFLDDWEQLKKRCSAPGNKKQ